MSLDKEKETFKILFERLILNKCFFKQNFHLIQFSRTNWLTEGFTASIFPLGLIKKALFPVSR